MAKILIVDDEKKMCLVLSGSLQDEGHDVDYATNGQEGVDKLKAGNYDIVLTDLRMPDIDGLRVLKEAKAANPKVGVILMTAHATADTAVTAMKEGAFDYLLKPFSLDDLFEMIEKIQISLLRDEESSDISQESDVNMIVGKSPKMIKVFKLVGQISQQDVTILIRGESGTGKELVAHAIHSASPRGHNPMVTVNCTALPEALFENELFGHDQEAFTGASSTKKGKFEAANKGSLFLDEIGDLSKTTQSKLLRVLEQKNFQRVGGTDLVNVDVRIIAATNVDLESAVKDKSFREDLFYRLNVFPIHLPPLRERKEDIPLLSKHFLLRTGVNANELSSSTLEILMNYQWPGNVRQLENTIVSSALRAKGSLITPEDLPAELNFNATRDEDDEDDDPPTTSLDLAQAEKKLIEQAIKKANGNKTQAAKFLGITRRALYSKLKGVSEEEDDSDS